MNFDFSPAQQTFRAEVRAWLAAQVPAELAGQSFTGSRPDETRIAAHRAWQHALYKAGYVGMDWPAAFGGRDASLVEQIIFYEELSRAQAPPPVNRGGLSMLGPTLMAHGHGLAATALPPEDPHRGGALVPGLLRAERRLGPGQRPDPRRAPG